MRGDALHMAISRSTHSFEISFKDRQGQTAFAQETFHDMGNSEAPVQVSRHAKVNI